MLTDVSFRRIKSDIEAMRANLKEACDEEKRNSGDKQRQIIWMKYHQKYIRIWRINEKLEPIVEFHRLLDSRIVLDQLFTE